MVICMCGKAFSLKNFKIKFWGESKLKAPSADTTVSYSSEALCGRVSQGMEGNRFRKQTCRKSPEQSVEEFEVYGVSLAHLHPCHLTSYLRPKILFSPNLVQDGFLSLTNQGVLTNTLTLSNNKNCRQRKMATVALFMRTKYGNDLIVQQKRNSEIYDIFDDMK